MATFLTACPAVLTLIAGKILPLYETGIIYGIIVWRAIGVQVKTKVSGQFSETIKAMGLTDMPEFDPLLIQALKMDMMSSPLYLTWLMVENVLSSYEKSNHQF